MSNGDRNNAPNDATGEIVSWIVTFVLLFAFWPVGLYMLLKKLRGYANPTKRSNTYSSGSARYTSTQQGSAHYNAGQSQAQSQSHSQAQSHSQTQNHSQSYSQTQNYSQGQTQQGQSQRSANQQTAAQKYDAQQQDARQNATSQYYGSAQAKQSASSKAAKKIRKKGETLLDKKSGKFVSVILLLIAIVMFVLGATGVSRGAESLLTVGGGWYDLFFGGFFMVGGLGTLFARNARVNRYDRYRNHYAFVANRSIVTIDEISKASGQSSKAAIRDIRAMISKGYFGPGAYIDKELDCLVLLPEAAKALKDEIKGSANIQEAVSKEPEKAVSPYMAIILELRELNETIIDIPISDKIDRIEELTAKIFRIVEDNPEKLPQIRRFMNYYLPTTLKLLRSYATLEKQDIHGENINAAKENIGHILDTLATGYAQQLDQLFEADAIDIAADINVLENMLQQDGLTGEKSEFRVMEST